MFRTQNGMFVFRLKLPYHKFLWLFLSNSLIFSFYEALSSIEKLNKQNVYWINSREASSFKVALRSIYYIEIALWNYLNLCDRR